VSNATSFSIVKYLTDHLSRHRWFTDRDLGMIPVPGVRFDPSTDSAFVVDEPVKQIVVRMGLGYECLSSELHQENLEHRRCSTHTRSWSLLMQASTAVAYRWSATDVDTAAGSIIGSSNRSWFFRSHRITSWVSCVCCCFSASSLRLATLSSLRRLTV